MIAACSKSTTEDSPKISIRIYQKNIPEKLALSSNDIVAKRFMETQHRLLACGTGDANNVENIMTFTWSCAQSTLKTLKTVIVLISLHQLPQSSSSSSSSKNPKVETVYWSSSLWGCCLSLRFIVPSSDVADRPCQRMLLTLVHGKSLSLPGWLNLMRCCDWSRCELHIQRSAQRTTFSGISFLSSCLLPYCRHRLWIAYLRLTLSKQSEVLHDNGLTHVLFASYSLRAGSLAAALSSVDWQQDMEPKLWLSTRSLDAFDQRYIAPTYACNRAGSFRRWAMLNDRIADLDAARHEVFGVWGFG